MLQIYLSRYCSDLVEGVMAKWENKMPTSKDGFEPNYMEPQIPLTAAEKKQILQCHREDSSCYREA